jgi:hypothetical protein
MSAEKGHPEYDKTAFEKSIDEIPFEPLPPGDGFSDVLGVMRQQALTTLNVVRFGGPILLVVTLAAAVWGIMGWNRPEHVKIQQVVVYCLDKQPSLAARKRAASEHSKRAPYSNAPAGGNAVPSDCYDKRVALASLLDLTRDQQAQILLAQSLLPIIVHAAFTIDTPDTNNYNWSHFVVPYLMDNSSAQTYFSNYLATKVPEQIRKGQTVEVRVDPIPYPNLPGQYVVGWVTKVGNGYKEAYEHTTAIINASFDPSKRTPLNQFGFYVSGIQIDMSNNSDESSWENLQS